MQKNFKYLDDLIHSGAKKMVLDSDIVLGDGEESQYLEGIKLDVDDMVIDGNGHSIDACGKARIFYCTGKSITIKNITLKNGYSKGDGGAIYNAGGTICNEDGVIYNEGAELSIVNSSFTENKARNGGAIYNAGVAIYNDAVAISEVGGKLSIVNSSFTENKANDAIAIYEFGGKLSIVNSSFTENKANDGGAIYNYSGKLSIVNSSFAENKAKELGGAIYSLGKLTITESTFTKNTTTHFGGAIYNSWNSELTITDSSFTENKARLDGGAIGGGGELSIDNSSFTENKAKNGGAIQFYSKIIMSNSNFEANSSTKYGGAIYIKVSDCILNHCKFTNNKSKNSGGAIYHYGNYRKESNNNNYSYSIVCVGCDFYNNSSDNDGGTIWSNCYTEIYNSNFCDNISKKEGNIIYFDGMSDITLNIENSFIRNNHAINSDIYLNNSSFTSIINTKINNVSDNYVIYNQNSKLTILNLKSDNSNKKIIYNNNILSIDKDNVGFIKSTKKSIIKYESQIPTSIKGFQYLEELINENSGYITLDYDIIMDENEEKFFEGGIDLEQDNLVLDGQNHTIDANNLSRIFIIMGNNITLKNIKFKNGFYFKNQFDQLKDGGGVIYSLPNTSVTIENCEFNENTSRNIAGCINNKGLMNIYRTKFNNNSAQKVCSTISNFNTLNLDGCDFKNNFAPFNDNSMHSYNKTAGNIVDEGSMVLNNCNFNKTKLFYIETLLIYSYKIPRVTESLSFFLFWIMVIWVVLDVIGFLSHDLRIFWLILGIITIILLITEYFLILIGKLMSYYIRKQGFDYHNYSSDKIDRM